MSSERYDQRLTMNEEENVIIVPAEDQTLVVAGESFTLVVPAEIRTIEVQVSCC